MRPLDGKAITGCRVAGFDSENCEMRASMVKDYKEFGYGDENQVKYWSSVADILLNSGLSATQATEVRPISGKPEASVAPGPDPAPPTPPPPLQLAPAVAKATASKSGPPVPPPGSLAVKVENPSRPIKRQRTK